MKNKITFLFFILCFIFLSNFNLNAQNYSIIDSIKADNSNIYVDILNNVYILEKQQISKYSPSGILLQQYKHNAFDALSYLDVSDPLKPLALSINNDKLYIFDQKLALINSYSLSETNVSNISCISNATNMHYWVYAINEQKLKKIDKNFNTIHTSEAFYFLVDNEEIPSQIYTSNQTVYIVQGKQVHFFDQFGVFEKTIVLPEPSTIQVLQNGFTFLANDSLNHYTFQTGEIKSLKLPKTALTKIAVKIVPNQLIISTENYIYIYSEN
jgi:hypothetical protein